MSNDLYKAPEAELLDSNQLKQEEFYVVSKKKFAILFFITIGIYSAFWFYEHWKKNKIANNSDIWPVPRAIFNIFFTHSLFKVINDKKEKVVPDSKPWNHSLIATLYVVLSVLSNFIDFIPIASNTVLVDFMFFILIPIFYWLLWDAQRMANIAQSDPKGNSNSSFSFWNYFWIVLGTLFWLLVLVGLLDSFGFLGDS